MKIFEKCPAMLKEEGVNIAIAFPIFGTGMRMKKSFPIFGNRNEEIMPNFWQREYEAGIPGNGQEQDVNISLFAIFLGFFQTIIFLLGGFSYTTFTFTVSCLGWM